MPQAPTVVGLATYVDLWYRRKSRQACPREEYESMKVTRNLLGCVVLCFAPAVSGASHPSVSARDFLAMSENERVQWLEQMDAADLDGFENALNDTLDRLTETVLERRVHSLRLARSMRRAARATDDGQVLDQSSVKEFLSLSESERMRFLERMDVAELDRFGSMLDDALDQMAEETLEAGVHSSRAARSIRRAGEVTKRSILPNGRQHMCDHLVGCQFLCVTAKTGCDVQAVGTLTSCRAHVDERYDCRGPFGAKCKPDRLNDLGWCAEQYANNLQRCANPWESCLQCCYGIDHYNPNTHDFGHCDNGWGQVELHCDDGWGQVELDDAFPPG